MMHGRRKYRYFVYGTENGIAKSKDIIEKEYDKIKYIALTEDYFPDKDKVYLIPCDILFPAFKFCNFEENYKIPSHLLLFDSIIGMINLCEGDKS